MELFRLKLKAETRPSSHAEIHPMMARTETQHTHGASRVNPTTSSEQRVWRFCCAPRLTEPARSTRRIQCEQVPEKRGDLVLQLRASVTGERRRTWFPFLLEPVCRPKPAHAATAIPSLQRGLLDAYVRRSLCARLQSQTHVARITS